ncbi:YceI family protein [Gelidibacter sediminis]|uniref:YceI family protein n=1 Tax=Gelidibacter sediminis TaxID=1608710 RepID=UPI001FBBF7C2|nr:YceI family protein [Gelidibacter sediminis]
MKLSNDSLKISGNLTLKAITKNIGFAAKYPENFLSAKFTLDRFQWNVAYEGSVMDKTMVDKDIEFTIAVKIE